MMHVTTTNLVTMLKANLKGLKSLENSPELLAAHTAAGSLAAAITKAPAAEFTRVLKAIYPGGETD